MKNPLLLVLLVALLHSCNNKPTQTEKLRLKFEKGDYQLVTVKTEYISDDKGSLSMVMDNETQMYFVVDSVLGNGDAYQFNAKLNKLSTRSGRRSMLESYDSEKPEAEMNATEKMMHEEFKKMLSEKMVFTMNNKGEITKPFTYVNGESIPATGQPMDMSNFQIIFPEEPVGIGSTWSNEKTNALTGGKTTTTYKIKSMNPENVVIDADAKIGGLRGSTEDKKAKGKYTLDRKTGKLIDGKLEMEMNAGFGDKGKLVITMVNK